MDCFSSSDPEKTSREEVFKNSLEVSQRKAPAQNAELTEAQLASIQRDLSSVQDAVNTELPPSFSSSTDMQTVG